MEEFEKEFEKLQDLTVSAISFVVCVRIAAQTTVQLITHSQAAASRLIQTIIKLELAPLAII